MMTTYTKPPRIRASDVKPEWHVIDADGKTLGRIASEVAVLLQGKHKATFVPNLNTGDYVIVLNAEKVRVTGKKLEQKRYYRHSGYIGGLREETLGDIMEKAPTRALTQAIKGMLPKSSLGRHMLSRLKVYAGDSHPHEAQLNAGAKAARAAEAREKAAKAPKKRTTRQKTTKKAAAEAAPKAEEQVAEAQAEAPAEAAVAEEEVKAPAAEAPVEDETAVAVEVEEPAEEEKPKAKPKRRATAAKPKAAKPKAKASPKKPTTKAKAKATPAEEPAEEESTEEESS